MPTTPEVDQTNPRRPLGIWGLSLYAAVIAGIIPTVAALLVVLSPENQEQLGLTTLSLFFSLALGLGIVVTSIGVIRGSDRSRKLLFLLLVIHYGLIIVNNGLLIFMDDLTSEEQTLAIARVLRSALIPALYAWYFSRPYVKPHFLPKNEA